MDIQPDMSDQLVFEQAEHQVLLEHKAQAEKAYLASQLKELAARLEMNFDTVEVLPTCVEITTQLAQFMAGQRLGVGVNTGAEGNAQGEEPGLSSHTLGGVWTVLNELPDAILVVRGDRIVFANAQLEDILEYEQSALVGRPWCELVAGPSEGTESELRTLIEMAEFEPVIDMPIRFVASGGEEVMVSASAHQSTFLAHEPYTILAIRDVSELKRLLSEALAASEAKSNFMANMTHEIRTPLSAMITLSELLEDSPLSAQQLEDVQTIAHAGNTLLSLVNDILDLSRLDAGQGVCRESDFEVRELIEQVERLFRAPAKAKALRIHTRIAAHCPQLVHSDAGKVRQVLINLVGNAVKFTEKGEVQICVGITELNGSHAIEFKVIDSGIGIPKQSLQEVFQAFHQLDGGFNRKHEGTGLGLNISKKMAELLGGTVHCESEVGQGSSFSFIIPCLEDKNAAEVGELERLTRGPILVAEDNPINQSVMTQLLTRLGWSCAIASNGSEALELLRENAEFTLVLMDCQMPIMDGQEATRQIRNLEGIASNIPIIAVTANNTEQDRRDCLESGMDDFMTKPVKFKMLAERLEHWAKEGSARRLSSVKRPTHASPEFSA